MIENVNLFMIIMLGDKNLIAYSATINIMAKLLNKYILILFISGWIIFWYLVFFFYF